MNNSTREAGFTGIELFVVVEVIEDDAFEGEKSMEHANFNGNRRGPSFWFDFYKWSIHITRLKCSNFLDEIRSIASSENVITYQEIEVLGGKGAWQTCMWCVG